MLFVLFTLLASSPHRVTAQRPSLPDSTRRDTLETVVVTAIRATLAAPAAQHVVTRADIMRAIQLRVQLRLTEKKQTPV